MIKYEKWQIKAATNARHNLRWHGVEVKNLTPAKLGFLAVSGRSVTHRLAAIAELVSRIDPNAVGDMMQEISVPTQQK